MDVKKLARLVERAKKNDEAAFAKIYDEFSKIIYYTALKMLGNAHDARDIVQDTMLVVYKKLGSIRDSKAFIAYVNRVAYNLCIKHIKKQKNLSVADDADDIINDMSELDCEFIPEEYVLKKEQRDLVVALVDELSEAHKAVILLYYYQQYSISQIAECLNLEQATVKTRLFRARSILKEKLEKQRLKEKMFMAAPIPVLTKILEQNASEVFTPEISGPIWESICYKLGFLETTIAETINIATKSAAETTAAGTVAAAGTAALLGYAKGLAVASAVALAIIGAATAIGKTGKDNVYIEANDTSLSENYIDTASSEPGAVSEQEDVYIEENETSLSKKYIDNTVSSEAGAASEQSEGATTPDEGLPHEGDNIKNDIISSGKEEFILQITLQKYFLTYPVGTKVTAQKILADSGAKCLTADGREMELTVKFSENIDFAAEGEYPVYVSLTDYEGENFYRIIILAMEGK